MTASRRFWIVALTTAGLFAAASLYYPLVRICAHCSINYNEGWNAYRQTDAALGKPLYGSPPGFVVTNYPPISFHLIGLLNRLPGSVTVHGRWTALCSLLLVGVSIAVIVFHFTGLSYLAAYAGLSFVVWLAIFTPYRVGVNDPQLLGTVFSVLGLAIYVSKPRTPGWLCGSAAAFAIAVFTKHNLLAFPAAVGLHVLWYGSWKQRAVWYATLLSSAAVIVFFTLRMDGPYFFANMLAPRTRILGLESIAEYAMIFQIPILVAVLWSLRSIRNSDRNLMVLACLLAHIIAFVFAGGAGVVRNIFFDCIVALAIISALAFAEFAPFFSGLKRQGVVLAALLALPSTGVLIAMPSELRVERAARRTLPSCEHDFDATAAFMKQRTGPAICGNLLLCFAAGKPMVYDPHIVKDLIRMHPAEEDRVTSLLRNAYFGAVQLDVETDGLVPSLTEPYFSPVFMRTLLEYYRVAARFGNSVVLVPKAKSAR